MEMIGVNLQPTSGGALGERCHDPNRLWSHALFQSLTSSQSIVSQGQLTFSGDDRDADVDGDGITVSGKRSTSVRGGSRRAMMAV